MLSKTELAALLGRPLTSLEDTNYALYIDIATKRLSNLLCFNPEPEIDETRLYATRVGYSTAFIDPFVAVTEVKVGGVVQTDNWTPMLNDSFRADWYNSLVFDEPLSGERIEVTGTWGFNELPIDLRPLLAGLFGQQEAMLKQNVKVKEVEDFRVEYFNGNAYDELVANHLPTIRKYAQCQTAVRHGLVQPVYGY
jgi:hypothetical protein